MAVLVAGGNGFIGINLVKALAQRGHEVISFDIKPVDALERKYVSRRTDLVAFVQGDIRKKSDLQLVASEHRITNIVNTVADNGHRPSNKAIRTMLNINVMAKLNLLDLASQIGVGKFVWVSSVNVYGYWPQDKELLTEDDRPAPDQAEFTTNYLGELMGRKFGEINGFKAVSVRINSTFGPMERGSAQRSFPSIFQEWTGNVVNGQPIKVPLQLNVGRQYGYVTDIVEGICAILEAPSVPHDLYNLSSPTWTPLKEVVDTLRRLRPSLQVVQDPNWPTSRWKTRNLSPVMDVSRIKKDLGFAPRFDLTTGLKELLEWRETFPYREYVTGA